MYLARLNHYADKMDYFALKFMPEEIINSKNCKNVERARNFILIFFMTFPLFPIFALMYHFLSTPHIELYCWISVVIVALSYPLFYFTRSTFLGAMTMSIGAATILIVASFYGGGIHAPGIIWFGSAQLLAGLLFNRKWAIFWILIYVLSAYVLGYASPIDIQLTNELNPQDARSIKTIAVIASSLVMFLTMAILNIFKRKSQLIITQKKLELEEALTQNVLLVRLLSHDINNSLFILDIMEYQIRAGRGNLSINLDRIREATANISCLVSHVREQQALISGKEKIVLSPVNLIYAVNKALKLLAVQSGLKNITIEFKTELNDEDAMIVAESTSLINVVLGNFLTNSIKFSHAGDKILLEIKKPNEFVVLTIKDHGIGIPQDILENLFNFGAQTSRQGTSGEKGTGFGMPLAKTYINMYNGSVNIESNAIADAPDNHGTTIHLMFVPEDVLQKECS